MSFSSGDWVEIPESGLAVVRDVDDARDIVTVEHPSGGVSEFPLPYARYRWTRLTADGLKVRLLLEPASVRRLAVEDPVELVAAAIRDLGGEGSTKALKLAVGRGAVAPDEVERWWRRVQPRLETDPRIDATLAAKKVYRVRRHGQVVVGPPREPVLRQETRRGRLLADARRLRAARERMSNLTPLADEERADLSRVAAIWKDERVDATDRYMAAELAVWLRELDEDTAIRELAADLHQVDLLRVAQHASRDLALRWAIEWSKSGDLPSRAIPLAQSAMAAGRRWSAAAGMDPLFAAVPRTDLGEAILAWSIPGSEESGPHSYPQELETYRKRVINARQAASSMDSELRAGLALGALRGLNTLPDSAAHMQLWMGTMDELAIAYQAAIGDQPRSRRMPVGGTRVRREAYDALLRQGGAKVIREDLLEAFGERPLEYLPSIRTFGNQTDTPVLDLALMVLDRILSTTSAVAIALIALDSTKEAPTSQSASRAFDLAASLAPQNQQVVGAILERSKRVVETDPDEWGALKGPVSFTTAQWQGLAREMGARLDAADRAAAGAEREAQVSASEVIRLSAILEQRTEALHDVRGTSATDRRREIQQITANALRPIAVALADAVEAQNLPVLLERLDTVLARGGIVRTIGRGEEQPFDPSLPSLGRGG